MVSLPTDFVATRYPGYFWNLKEQKLYTMKVTGVLRPLVKPLPSFFNHYRDIYKVSHNGKRRTMEVSTLKKLKAKDSVIPMEAS